MTRLAFRADHIGSLLRPAFLLHRRAQYSEGRLSDAEFRQLEDRAVDEAIALQERSGIDAISDGEQRRNVFASQIVESCDDLRRPCSCRLALRGSRSSV